MLGVPYSVTCLRRLRHGLLHTQPVAVSAHLFGSKARTRTAAKRQHFCCQPLRPAQVVRVIRLMENFGFQLETTSKTCLSVLQAQRRSFLEKGSKQRQAYRKADENILFAVKS